MKLNYYKIKLFYILQTTANKYKKFYFILT